MILQNAKSYTTKHYVENANGELIEVRGNQDISLYENLDVVVYQYTVRGDDKPRYAVAVEDVQRAARRSGKQVLLDQLKAASEAGASKDELLAMLGL